MTGGSINVSGSIVGSGGSIDLDAGSQGTLLVSGTIDVSNAASGQTGGTVYLQGNQVGLMDSALINASGDAGNGTVFVGGGFHGGNPAILDASQTYVSPDATISADAITSGNGGDVAVWSNESTEFYGQISARGGAAGGDGGYVEVSGHHLDFQGQVSTIAPAGKAGALLLDPENLTIDNGSNRDSERGRHRNVGKPVHDDSRSVRVALVDHQQQLGSGNVYVTTVSPPGYNNVGQAGNITRGTNSPTMNSSNLLTLTATGGITVSGSITNTGTGGLTLTANNGAIAINQAISIKGTLTATASGAITNREAAR